MKSPLAAAAVVALLLPASLALAQTTSPAPVIQADRTYLQKDSRGAEYELELSQLALQKAQNPQVRQYAQMIVHQHEQANQQLQQVAQENGVMLPGKPNHQERQRLARLTNLSGPAFDKAYVQDVKRANQMDVKDEQKELGSTRNPTIRQFVQAEQQMDQQHTQAAQALQANGSSNS